MRARGIELIRGQNSNGSIPRLGEGATKSLRPNSRSVRVQLEDHGAGEQSNQGRQGPISTVSASVPRRQLRGLLLAVACLQAIPAQSASCFSASCGRTARPWFRERKRTTFTSPPHSKTQSGQRLVSCERSVGTCQGGLWLPTPPDTTRVVSAGKKRLQDRSLTTQNVIDCAGFVKLSLAAPTKESEKMPGNPYHPSPLPLLPDLSAF